MLFRGQFDWFWEIHFHPQICRFLGAGTFLTSLRLFVKKFFLRSRRAHCDFTKNTKFYKYLKFISKLYQFYHISSVLRWFWEFYIPPQICRSLGAGTILTSLRLFVKKNFLRSRRAQCDNTKNIKIWKILWNCT